MNKRIIVLSLAFVVFLATAFVFLNKADGKHKLFIKLDDGETIVLDSVYNSISDNSISENLSKINLSSVVLRSFDTDSNNINDIKSYVNYLINQEYIDYWQITPSVIRNEYSYGFVEDDSESDDKKVEGFNNYYHTIFRNKNARNLLFNKGLDFVESMCKVYPIDFKMRVQTELDSLLLFTNSIKHMSPDDDFESDNYWKGFILRRHFTDKVPILEIQNSLVQAKNRLKISTNPITYNAYYEINLNNQITIFKSIEGTYISSKTSSKKFILKDSDYIKSIRFLKDLSGDYYQITVSGENEDKKYLLSSGLEPAL